jgi:hypothetical protein
LTAGANKSKRILARRRMVGGAYAIALVEELLA